jgi:hypothetical protein
VVELWGVQFEGLKMVFRALRRNVHYADTNGIPNSTSSLTTAIDPCGLSKRELSVSLLVCCCVLDARDHPSLDWADQDLIAP